jgi:hypothetical protein
MNACQRLFELFLGALKQAAAWQETCIREKAYQESAD